VNKHPLEDKRILITGGTGSLGKVLVRRLLSGGLGTPKQIIIFSRDEAKQYLMRLSYLQRDEVTDEVIYRNSRELLSFRIGDVRDEASVSAALHGVDVVFNAAALKQVPSCEYFPEEAIKTNISGPSNIVRAAITPGSSVETVVGISTDKAAKPVNVMGMTKALQERILIRANMDSTRTRFVCVRYGNVLASRGSVIPLFHEQIRNGGPVTITTPDMTRFLLSLNQAVDMVFEAVVNAHRGEIYIPKVPAARITDVASVLIDHRPIEMHITGIRPGEKVHEILITEEEVHRTVDRGDYYAIQPVLPELVSDRAAAAPLPGEYSSAGSVMTREEVYTLLYSNRLLIDQGKDSIPVEDELLR